MQKSEMLAANKNQILSQFNKMVGWLKNGFQEHYNMTASLLEH